MREWSIGSSPPPAPDGAALKWFSVRWNEQAAMPPAWLAIAGGNRHLLILTAEKNGKTKT
jgi:hypothetical protein